MPLEIQPWRSDPANMRGCVQHYMTRVHPIPRGGGILYVYVVGYIVVVAVANVNICMKIMKTCSDRGRKLRGPVVVVVVGAGAAAAAPPTPTTTTTTSTTTTTTVGVGGRNRMECLQCDSRDVFRDSDGGFEPKKNHEESCAGAAVVEQGPAGKEQEGDHVLLLGKMPPGPCGSVEQLIWQCKRRLNLTMEVISNTAESPHSVLEECGSRHEMAEVRVDLEPCFSCVVSVSLAAARPTQDSSPCRGTEKPLSSYRVPMMMYPTRVILVDFYGTFGFDSPIIQKLNSAAEQARQAFCDACGGDGETTPLELLVLWLYDLKHNPLRHQIDPSAREECRGWVKEYDESSTGTWDSLWSSATATARALESIV